MAANSPQTNSIMRVKAFKGKIIAVISAFVLWQVTAMLLSHFLLPTPIAVAARIFDILKTPDTYSRLLFTFLNLSGGFFLGLLAGAALAVPAARYKFFEDMLWPFMLTAKSVPVVSFIILAYLYLSAREIPVIIAFLMVLPLTYNNILAGIKNSDPLLLQMADVFKLSWKRRFLYITLPQIKPYLLSASKSGIGLAFKSGVAAEVITLAAGSIGEMLYRGKLFLETDLLFGWTILLLIICYGFEWLFTALIAKIFKETEKL